MARVEIAGSVSTSQDGIVVKRGGYHLATPQDTATARRYYGYSRPHNTTFDGLCYTLNTRYEDAGINDMCTAKHCKTCVMFVYET